MAAGAMRGVCFLLAVCAPLSGARRVGAAPLSIDWQAPACAQQAVFRARVRDALQRDPESALESELRVAVQIGKNPTNTGYSLQIRMAAGTRELETPSCDEAVAAAATVVALTIDPHAVAPTATEPAPADQRTVPRPPAAKPAEPKAARLPSVQSPRLEPYVTAFGGVSAGEVPALSPLVSASVGGHFRWLGVGGEGFWIAPQTQLLAGTDKGGELRLWGAGLSACYLPLRRNLRLSACLAAQAGAWHSRGVGVTSPTAQNDWWAAGVARLQGGVRVASVLGLFLAADVVVPARRPWFRLEGVGGVFRPKPLAERFSAGVELSF